jgi:serine/threonine protein kinase
MPILRPIEGRLNPFQKNYVKESIRMLHSAGLSHNDIHLGNIMIRTIGENEYPVIIDFGLIGLRDDGSNDFEKFDEFFVNRPPEIPSRRKRDRDAS